MMDNKDWLARVAEDIAQHQREARELDAVETSDLVWMVRQLDSLPSTYGILDPRTLYRTISYMWMVQYCTKKRSEGQ